MGPSFGKIPKIDPPPVFKTQKMCLLKRTGTYQIFQRKPEHGTIQGIHEWIITDTHFLWNNVRPLTGTSAN